MTTARSIDVAGRTLTVSRPDKVLFPDLGLTKAQLVDYYLGVAEVMVPHLAGRPAVLRRFPDGIVQDGFFQKDASDHFPDWIRTVRVERVRGGIVEHVVVDDAATLGYLADQATVELHVWLSPVDRLHRPDQLVIDLDPPGDDVDAARWATRQARDLLRDVGLDPLVKTTGSKGYHVHVPLDASADVDEVRDVAARLVRALAQRHPDRLTTAPRKRDRGRRVYLDVGRTAYGQHAVAPYSVRARPGAPVATPIEWDELGRADPQRFTVRNLFRRLGQKDDPWIGAADRGASLEETRRRLDDPS